MLNLEWIRTFKAVYETGTLSAAAQMLYISQPGASLHLNALESFTGYRLFERETRGMVPTAKAVLFYNFVNDPLSKLEKAEKLFHRNCRDQAPVISVGMSFESFSYALEEYIPELPFNLVVRVGDYAQILRELETGALDLIITPRKGPEATLKYKPFAKERLVLVCGALNDTSELELLMLSDDRVNINRWLSNQVWFTNTVHIEHLKDFWMLNFDSAPDFKPNFVLPYFSSIIKSLRNGKGFALIPDFLCAKEIEQLAIKLVWQGTPHLENKIYFGSRIKSSYPKELKQLEEILLRNFRPYQPD